MCAQAYVIFTQLGQRAVGRSMTRMLFDFFLEPAQRPIIVSSPVLRRRLLGILRADLIEALALLKLCGGAKASGDRLRSSPKCRGGCSRPTKSAAETGATECFPAATPTQPVRRFQLGGRTEIR